jgi:TRAP-type C4-dicarboxylate transport system permease small subunit
MMLAFLVICDRGLSGLLRALVIVTSAVITLALVTLVISRYFFDISLSGMHETSILAAMWLYMGGAVLASRRSEHLVVDFLAGALHSPRAKALHDLLIAVLTLIVVAFVAQWVWGMFAWGMKRPQTIPILNVPLWWAQAPLALMVVSAALYGLRDTARAILALRAAAQKG